MLVFGLTPNKALEISLNIYRLCSIESTWGKEICGNLFSSDLLKKVTFPPPVINHADNFMIGQLFLMPTAHYTTRRDTTRRDNSRQKNRVMCGGLRLDATRQDKNRASS